MQRQDIDSRLIRSVGYEPETETLEVEFKNSGLYRYMNVPQTEYDAMMEAESQGSYFLKQVRDAYTCLRLD